MYMKSKKPILPENKINEVDAAKKIIADAEVKEIEAIGKEVTAFMEALKARGFSLIVRGEFAGNRIETGLQVVKIK